MICVDASLILALLFKEPPEEKVIPLWEEWVGSGRQIYAPYLLHYEVYNNFRTRTRLGLLEEKDQKKMAHAYHSLPITFIADNELLDLAIGLCNQHNLPAIYDAIYLALAQKMSLEFWTADRKLARLLSKRLSFVNTI
jgi:predicted nucleic acid-binding protein